MLISSYATLIAGLDEPLKRDNGFIYREEKTCSNLI